MDLDSIVGALSAVDWGQVIIIYIILASVLFPLMFLVFGTSVRKRKKMLKEAEEKREAETGELQNKLVSYKAKYSSIIDVEEATEKEKEKLSSVTSDVENVKKEYNEKRPYLDELKSKWQS